MQMVRKSRLASARGLPTCGVAYVKTCGCPGQEIYFGRASGRGSVVVVALALGGSGLLVVVGGVSRPRLTSA